MRKILLLSLILFLLTTGCGSVQNIENFKETTDKNVTTEEVNIPESKEEDNDKNVTTEEVNIPEKIEENVDINIKAIDSEKEIKKETNNKSNSKNNVEEKKEEIKVKHVCNNNDQGYVKWKNEFLSIENSARLFNSFDDAYNKGKEMEFTYFYGFTVHNEPIKYSDDDCEISHYLLQLYVMQGICENNPMMYVPYNINNMNDIEYLKSIGYECAGKS